MAYLRTSNYEFSQQVDLDNDPDYVYLNMSIINNNAQAFDVGLDPAVRFQETRDMPIIRDASKYNFSIIRANLNGINKDLPLFIPVIRTGSANPNNDVNLTIYSLTLTMSVSYLSPNPAVSDFAGDFAATVPIIWSSETADQQIAPIPLPSTCQTGQDISTRYYWCYTYSHMLGLFANASNGALAEIQTMFNAAWVAKYTNTYPAPTLKTVAPQMTWNPSNGLFTLYCDTYSFGGVDRTSINTNEDERCTLYFNNNMYGLFSNFNNTYYNGRQIGTYLLYNGVGPTFGTLTDIIPEATNEIIVRNILSQNILFVPSTSHSYYVVQQDYESTSTLWSPIESIVFTSALLPLVFEQIGDPIRFGQGNDNATNSGRPAFSPIITDISLTNENANSYRSFIQYSPTAEYRLASFQRSKSPINAVDIQIYWKNRLDGQLYPIQMYNCSSVSVKIMFRRIGALSR
jgi:hypothetical protein